MLDDGSMASQPVIEIPVVSDGFSGISRCDLRFECNRGSDRGLLRVISKGDA